MAATGAYLRNTSNNSILAFFAADGVQAYKSLLALKSIKTEGDRITVRPFYVYGADEIAQAAEHAAHQSFGKKGLFINLYFGHGTGDIDNRLVLSQMSLEKVQQSVGLSMKSVQGFVAGPAALAVKDNNKTMYAFTSCFCGSYNKVRPQTASLPNALATEDIIFGKDLFRATPPLVESVINQVNSWKGPVYINIYFGAWEPVKNPDTRGTFFHQW